MEKIAMYFTTNSYVPCSTIKLHVASALNVLVSLACLTIKGLRPTTS